MSNPTNVTTGKVRLSYANLFEPRSAGEGQEPKYSVMLLIPKTDTVTMNNIYQAIEAAKANGLANKWNGVVPPNLRTPIKDGDGVKEKTGEPYGPECKGHWLVTASSDANHPPQVVDQRLQPIIDRSQVYSGCYAHVNLNFYAWGSPTFGKGISAGLGPVQKVADGEHLGGSAPDASAVFSVVETPQTTPMINPLTGLPM